MSRLSDLPIVGALSAELAPLRAWIDAVSSAFRARDPVTAVGDPLDKFVARSELVASGLSYFGGLHSGGFAPGGPAIAGLPGFSAGQALDLTPPSTATGLVVTASFSSLLISCDAAFYTQGHGHDRTVVYGAKWPTSNQTPPTFGAAVPLFDFKGTVAAYSTELGTRWCIWIKWRSQDGVLSTDPAGGVNGVQATTGKIGNADLNDLIVSADKLSVGTYGGINLVANPGAEDGTVSWALTEGVAATFTADTTDKTSGSAAFKITKAATADASAYGCRAMAVIPGETYSVKLRLRSSAASASGLTLRMNQMATAPTGGVVTAALRASLTDLLANAASTLAFTLYEFTYTVPAGMFWATLAVHNGAGSALGMWFDDVQFGRQITASHLAAGSIAVGSAAIANAAIRRALIEDLAVDNAKIDNLSAAKLTVGDGTIGGNLKSSNYAAGSAGWLLQPNGVAEFGAASIRGQLVASQINSNGLSIRDTSGNVILAAGSALSGAENIVGNPSGDVNADGWEATVSRVAANTFFQTPAAPCLYTQFADVGFVGFQGGRFRAAPGESYSFSIKSTPQGGLTSAYDFKFGVAVYDAAGTLLAIVYPAIRLGTSSGVQTATGVYTMPANAYSAFPYLALRTPANAGTGDLGSANAYFFRDVLVRRQVNAGNASTYIANLSVNTLQMAANAATGISASGSDSGLIAFANPGATNYSGNTSAAALTTTGSPVFVNAIIEFELSPTNTLVSHAVMNASLMRNGTVIQGGLALLPVAVTAGGTRYISARFALVERDTGAAAGANTYAINYTFTLYIAAGTTTTPNGGVWRYKVNIVAMENKI